jgi:hypothetical protein
MAKRAICYVCRHSHIANRAICPVCNSAHTVKRAICHMCNSTHIVKRAICHMCNSTHIVKRAICHMCNSAHIVKRAICHMCNSAQAIKSVFLMNLRYFYLGKEMLCFHSNFGMSIFNPNLRDALITTANAFDKGNHHSFAVEKLPVIPVR